MTRFHILKTLLSSLFSATELRIYLRQDSRTADLVDELPDEPASKSSLTSAAVGLLESKGLSTQLLHRLAEDRSYQGRRADVLHALQELQTLPSADSPNSGPPPCAQSIHNQDAQIGTQINIVGNPVLHLGRDKP